MYVLLSLVLPLILAFVMDTVITFTQAKCINIRPLEVDEMVILSLLIVVAKVLVLGRFFALSYNFAAGQFLSNYFGQFLPIICVYFVRLCLTKL